MPISTITADLALILQDIGVPFTHGADRGYGKWRHENLEGITDTGLTKLGVRHTFIVSDATITAPKLGDVIVIDGVNYSIRDPAEALDDGTRRLEVVKV